MHLFAWPFHILRPGVAAKREPDWAWRSARFTVRVASLAAVQRCKCILTTLSLASKPCQATQPSPIGFQHVSHNYIGVSGPHACSRYPDERRFSSVVVNVEQSPSASGQAHHSGKSAFQNGRDGVEESSGRYLAHHPKTPPKTLAARLQAHSRIRMQKDRVRAFSRLKKLYRSAPRISHGTGACVRETAVTSRDRRRGVEFCAVD